MQRRRTHSVVSSVDTRSPEAKVKKEQKERKGRVNQIKSLATHSYFFVFFLEIGMGGRAMLSVSAASSDEQVFGAA